jgi:RNA polymerase sigma factor (sigma-70 family)
MISARTSTVLQHVRRLAGARRTVVSGDRQLLERFVTRRDESAFAALVRQHGPMVLNVCRSVLHHEQDAEDSFQATFLVLARKAESIRQPEAVAGWLCEVAYRVAVKARAASARRRDEEQRGTPMAAADPTLDMTLRDLRRVLHEELGQLPEKYRVPLVLCYLEGRSHEEAAGQLGWSKGAFRGRLDRGREHLRRRLAARGVALSAVLFGTAIAPAAAGETLVHSVVRAVMGDTKTGGLPARVIALADGVARATCTSKLKVVVLGLIVVGLVAGAGALARDTNGGIQKRAGVQTAASAALQAAEETRAKPQAARNAKPQAAQEKDSVTYSGRVLDPEGKPIAGAKLYLTPWWGGAKWTMSPPPCASSGSDGRFVISLPLAKYRNQFVNITATTASLGPNWVDVARAGPQENLTIRLVRDDVPISGQIVDLEARPVASSTLKVESIYAAVGEDLGPWLEAIGKKEGFSLQLRGKHVTRHTTALATAVTTDDEGRFRLIGIGANRLVTLRLDGPTIVSQRIRVLTRPGKTIEVPDNEGNPEYGEKRTVTTYYGAEFRHVAAPSKPIVGVIRDRDTKKPLAGFTIQSMTLATNPMRIEHIVETRSDEKGRYRLTGMPKGKGSTIMVVPSREQPYVAVHAAVPDSPGLAAVTVDFDMKLGVWIEGKITDKVTGKPVKGSIEYFSLYSNPNLRDYPGFDGTFLPQVAAGTKEDGTYRIAGIPGPGLIAAWYVDGYLRSPERDDEFGIAEMYLSTAPYHLHHPINYGALARINPPKATVSLKRDLTFDPGWTFTGTVLGPDGKPLVGVRGNGLTAGFWWPREGMKTAEFTVRRFNPRRSREVLFQHLEKGLVGVARPPRENGGSITVRMEPGATVTGRLVDGEGMARPDVELELWVRSKQSASWYRNSPPRVQTDREGRFRIGALLPGYEFRMSHGRAELSFGGALRGGQTKDLGDVRLKKEDE